MFVNTTKRNVVFEYEDKQVLVIRQTLGVQLIGTIHPLLCRTCISGSHNYCHDNCAGYSVLGIYGAHYITSKSICVAFKDNYIDVCCLTNIQIDNNVLRTLAITPTLVCVSLNSMNISQSDFELFTSLLKTNTNIKVLWLFCTELTNIDLLNPFISNPQSQLRTLKLTSNHFRVTHAFMDSISSSPSIINVNIKQNPIIEQPIIDYIFSTTLRYHLTLRRLNLAVPLDISTKIDQRLRVIHNEDAKRIFTILSSKIRNSGLTPIGRLPVELFREIGCFLI